MQPIHTFLVVNPADVDAAQKSVESGQYGHYWPPVEVVLDDDVPRRTPFRNPWEMCSVWLTPA